MRKVFKSAVPCLLLIASLSCQTGGTDIQPIVIDFSGTATPAPTSTPTAAPPARPTAIPAPPPPAPSPVEASAPREDRPAVAAAEAVVRRLVDVHNRRDLEELAGLYAPDARIYEPPDRLRDSGLAAIRADYARRFSSSTGSVAVGESMTEGRFVVQREVETEASGRTRSAIVISEVRDGKIVKQWILR